MSETRIRRKTIQPPLEYNAEIVERRDCTNELSIFRIRHDQPMDSKRAFVPGQYVALGLNNLETPELGSVRRSMSLASAPEEEGTFEFYIRWVKHPESDNPLTHLLWKTSAGDRIFMTRKPVGKFTIPDTLGDDTERYKILVAAGTGLAPFVSMARSAVLADSSVDLSRWVVLHGASYPADLVYGEELEGYHRDYGLKYFRTVSRPQEAPDWSGDVGRVEDYFKPDRLLELERRVGLPDGGLTPRRAGVLICGLQGTIAQCIVRTVGRGFVPDVRRIRRALAAPSDAQPSLWWEQYDKTPVIDIDDEEVMAPLRASLAAGLAAL